jgi:hypothetical protein
MRVAKILHEARPVLAPGDPELLQDVPYVAGEHVRRLGRLPGGEVGVEAHPRPVLRVPDPRDVHGMSFGPDSVGDGAVIEPDERVAGVQEDGADGHAYFLTHSPLSV